jgi:hypothetical protein
MSRKFNVGDIVRIIGGPRKGEIATVIGELSPAELVDIDGRLIGPAMVHRLDLESIIFPGRPIVAPPHDLQLYYDGNDAVTWTADLVKLCKPAKERA